MSPTITAMVAACLAIGIGIVAVLLRWYLRSRNIGALVLLFALVVLPILLFWPNLYVRAQLNRLAEGEALSTFPFSMVSAGTIAAGDLLVFFAYADKLIVLGCTLIGLVLLTRRRKPHGEAVRRTVQT